jgi:biopolymer transport protein TolQ
MNELVRFVLQSGLVAKIVLLILFVLSVISWGIVIEKARLFWKVFKENDKFVRLFTLRVKWSDRFTYSREFKSSPMAKIFRKNFNDIKVWIENSFEDNGLSPIGQNPLGINKQRIQIHSLFDVGIAEEIAILEKRIVFLGTTVSVSPFLGLLGTVWGIMTSFLSMGVKGSAEIAAVGPGIAEALITTLAGLAVAIPALVAHNYFVNKLRQVEKDMENFFANLIITVERERPL